MYINIKMINDDEKPVDETIYNPEDTTLKL